jgi:hypothetical protein
VKSTLEGVLNPSSVSLLRLKPQRNGGLHFRAASIFARNGVFLSSIFSVQDFWGKIKSA